MHSSYPTRSQKRTLWIALTAVATVTIGAIAVGAIWLGTWILGYLQPLLIPFAVATVLGYLLYPLVRKLKEGGMEPKKAGTLVFTVFIVIASALMTFVVSTGYRQANNLIDEYDTIQSKFETFVDSRSGWLNDMNEKLGKIFQGSIESDGVDSQDPKNENFSPAEVIDSSEPAVPPMIAAPQPHKKLIGESEVQNGVDVLLKKLKENAGKLFRRSLNGFLGTFGFIFGMFIVPIYLFFFLREAPRIQESWSDYLPIRASRFKTEVVATLKEINDYLIAFFRGQMLVSLIDGAITAVLLSLLGLKFGLLIGLLVGILGIIPYIGIILCFIPAIIIAIVQGKDWSVMGFIHIQDPAWWLLPLIVTIVFVAVQNIDGILIAPKIVGDSVGLHPFTVIFSVLFWSTLLGGLLGSILAVPLTAAIKVIFTRYVWAKKLRPGTVGGAPKETLAEPSA